MIYEFQYRIVIIRILGDDSNVATFSGFLQNYSRKAMFGSILQPQTELSIEVLMIEN